MFDVGGRRPEGVDKLGQLVLHDEFDVDVEEGDGERKERTLRHGMITYSTGNSAYNDIPTIVKHLAKSLS